MNIKNVVIISILIILNLHCAFLDVKIDPKFQTKKSIKIPSGNGRKVFISQIYDLDIMEAQGIVKNGYGVETAKVYTKESPESIIRSGLEELLRNADYVLVNKKDEGDISFKIFINQFFTEPIPGYTIVYWSIVDVDLYADVLNKKFYKINLIGLGRVNSMSVFANEKRELSLSLAIEDVTIKILRSISELSAGL